MENNRIVDFSKTSLHDIYGENCFNDAIMRELLPKAVYKELKEVQQGNKELTLETANAVASAMKTWAVSKGATHFTHWFQRISGNCGIISASSLSTGARSFPLEMARKSSPSRSRWA